MDALAGLLDGPRARGAFLLRAVLDPPWSLRIRDEAPLTVVALVRGHAWVTPPDGVPVRLGPGDVAVARGPEPYLIADDPATPVQVVIHPNGRCATPAGEDLHDEMTLGVRTWGTSTTGSTEMLVGTYLVHSEIGTRLTRELPTLLTVGHPDGGSPLVGLLADEIGRDEPGQEAVLDRLLDLLLISVLRTWFARPGAHGPSWLRALGDPVVGRAVRLLHQNPAHPWTVALLADKVGVSRAALARRFATLVGEPPMAFLTAWRLAMAADLLREPDATLASVARQVGYGTAFALSTAFKRERGISPAGWRTGAPDVRPTDRTRGSTGDANADGASPGPQGRPRTRR